VRPTARQVRLRSTPLDAANLHANATQRRAVEGHLGGFCVWESYHLMDCLPTSFVGPPWPAQTVRIAGAAPDLITLAVGQALAAPPAAESRLNRPRFKQKLRPVGANVGAGGVRRCDPEQLAASAFTRFVPFVFDLLMLPVNRLAI
jgi:hypothetical protein